MASWPSGKARVCKTLITGPNPVDASNNFRLVIYDLRRKAHFVFMIETHLYLHQVQAKNTKVLNLLLRVSSSTSWLSGSFISL